MTISIKNLSVVIVSFHSQEVIDNCIKSISNEIQIIVVENSRNKTVKSTLESKYKNVKCILSPENLGMGAGNNFGLTFVQTDFAFILNPDVILEKNTIEEIITASKNLEIFGLIAPISDDLNYPNYKIFKKNNSIINKNTPFRAKSVDGFAMILNIKKLKQSSYFRNNNFFDENFFMYLENDDLCKRINNNNEKIFIVPTSKIKHLGGKAVNKKYNDEIELSRNWHWMWSTFYYNKKYSGYLISLIKIFPKLIKSFFKTIFYFLILNKKKGSIYLHRMLGILNSLLGQKSWYRPKV